MNGIVVAMAPERFQTLLALKCIEKGHVEEDGACVRCGERTSVAATKPETPQSKRKARQRVDKALPGATKEPIVEVPPEPKPEEPEEPEPATEPRPATKQLANQIVGIDPGFAAIGYTTLGIGSDGLHIEKFGVFTTKKTAKKHHAFAVEDNLRRALEIAHFLGTLIEPDTVAICAEAMSHPRSASVAAKIAMTWGVIARIAAERQIPIFQASPQEVKLEACGNKSASKEDVQTAMRARYKALRKLETKVPPKLHEHCFDALAAAETCVKAGALQAAKRIS